MKPVIVRGHVCTWKITPTEDSMYEVTPGQKKYKDIPTAKWAIRTAETRYVKDHPDYPVANRDIWFDHGTLVVDDFDGNYYESRKCESFDFDKVQKRIACTDEFDNGKVMHDDYFNSTSDEAEEKAKKMSLDNPDKTFYVKYDDVMNPCSDIKWKNGEKITESSDPNDELVEFIKELDWDKPDTKYGDEYDVIFVKDWDPELGDIRVLQIEKADGTVPYYDAVCDSSDFDRLKREAIKVIRDSKKVEEGKNTTGRYVWCPYRYVSGKSPDQFRAFVQKLFNDRYYSDVKVTHFDKDRYNEEEVCQEYIMYADGLDDNYDSFHFLVQCTEEESEELPDSDLYDTGDPASYYIDYFHQSDERYWVTGYDNDSDKDLEITLCNGESDKDKGRKKALEILKNDDYNVDKDARNKMISTFGLDNFGLSVTESTEVETDPEKLATNVEITSEPQDDETLADKIENEIHKADPFIGKKCIYTYKGLIGTQNFCCPDFDQMEKDLYDISGTEVEVISGNNEYGYMIKSGSKEFYGVRAEELLLHDDNEYGAKEVDLPKSMTDNIKKNVTSLNEDKVKIPFKLDHVGIGHYDSMLSTNKISGVTESEYYKFEKGLSGRIVYMTPDKYFDELDRADIYNNPRNGIDQDNVDRIAEDLSKGVKYNIPFIDYAFSGQEGRHRMMACKKLYGDDTKVPCLVVEITQATEDEIKDYAERRWKTNDSYWVNYVKSVLDNVQHKYSVDRYS